MLPASRAEAKSMGSTRYFTGRVCKYGHVAERWTASGLCADCNRKWLERNAEIRRQTTRRYRSKNKEQRAEYLREWRRNNPENFRAQWLRFDANHREELRIAARERYQADPDHTNEITRRYRERHPDRVSRQGMNYRKRNPGKRAAWQAARTSAKLQATPAWADMESIERFYEEAPEGMTVDHIVPLRSDVVCGLHVRDNLQYLTFSENARKGNRFKAS